MVLEEDEDERLLRRGYGLIGDPSLFGESESKEDTPKNLENPEFLIEEIVEETDVPIDIFKEPLPDGMSLVEEEEGTDEVWLEEK